MSNSKVWFITGASKGLGLSLTKQLLQQGHRVVATSRNIHDLLKAVGDNNHFLPLQVNLASDSEVAQAVKSAREAFGRIDVVVNNAGYGIGGSVEELTDEETRDSFNINVFGTLHVIRRVMPYLREQQSGHIINISSIAGFTANTGWAVYAAAKYAIVGLSEVLAADVKSFGVKVTVVAPGAFRTSFLNPESLVMTKQPIEAYEEVRKSHARYLQMDGMQAGDPEKAAAAMISITEEKNPPLYLLLGKDAFDRALQKTETLNKTFHEWETLTKSTDYSL